MKPQTIFFIGKPGCGKGTQAKILSEKTKWNIIASGEQFRSIATEDTPIGNKIKSEIDAGVLAPHWFAVYLYLKSLFDVGGDSSIIFDGFNRKEQEAKLVVDSLVWLGRSFTVINLVVSDEEVRRRLIERKDVEHRADDDAIEERLKEYYEYTEPAIQIFRNKSNFVEINGEQITEKITDDIISALRL